MKVNVSSLTPDQSNRKLRDCEEGEILEVVEYEKSKYLDVTGILTKSNMWIKYMFVCRHDCLYGCGSLYV